jgi:crotonobetaine/carnitine-CoA ligase
MVGEIAVRPTVNGIMMAGYYKMPKETLGTLSNLWLHTGDRGYLDTDGYLYFVDRKKDAIRRRGENISAYELEMIVCKHASIREAAAVAVPSELGEDDVLVYLVMEQGHAFNPEAIINFCDQNMPYFMVPRYLEAIDDLPKTNSEKIEKYRLRQMASERMSDIWDREAHGIKLTR